MAFTGAWRMNAHFEPDERVVHVADAAHAKVGPDQGVQPETYLTPQQLDPGPVGEYPGMEFVVTTPGRVIDTTDYESHQADTTHQADHGAALAGVFGEVMTRFHDERYVTDRFEGIASTEVNPVALQRGRNGLAENNPEGFRRGWIDHYFEFRKFPIGERVHDHRIIYPDLPQADTGTPALDAGAYPMPFASLARNMTTIANRPQARREPPPMYGDLIVDGAPLYPSVVGDIGVIG